MITGTTKFNDFSFEYVAPLYLLNVSKRFVLNIKDIYIFSQLDHKQIEDALISEIRLSDIQAKIFLQIIMNGRMTSKEIAEKLGITENMANENSNQLIQLGGLIDYTETEFEALHPRFGSVNMYRIMCERENLEFKKNNLVDNIGISLENSYDDVRTKYKKRK